MKPETERGREDDTPVPRPLLRLLQEMSPGVRQLTVLGNFKPFGLIAEALDGKPAHSVPHHYDYFLFDPEIARERDETDGTIASCLSTSNQSDHELFIRGNR